MAELPKAVIDTLIAEAAGEGPEGMRRVAETILNRAAIRGLTLEQVVKQPYQYTGYSAPGPAAIRAQSDPKVRSAAEAALRLAMEPGDPTGGADHYFAPGTISTPSWANSMTPKGDYGGHRFYASRPIPPGEIPNVVASQLDTKPPPRIQGKAGAPANNRATAAAPTQWFTPRLAPGNGDIYSYHLADITPASLVGGKGSLTPTIGQRDPIPMPRPRPSTAVAGFPTPRPTYTPSPSQRLPDLPPSNLASPRVVNASIERANAAVDPGLKRALEQRVAAPAMIDTSMKRAANAVDPALQRALDAATRPAAPSMAKAPTGPALSRDSIAQAALGRDTVQRLGTTPFSPSAPTLAAPVLDPSRIPGPPAVIKTADALPAGVYPAMSPAVATALDVVPSIPLPRPRPVAPVTFAPVIKPVTGFPTAANLRPTAPLLAMTMPTQLGMRPPSYAPLKIAINGANSYSAPSTATPFQGAATGRTYVPGQQYVMNGQTYSAKQGGGFVNDKTGREVAKGTGWQALHGLN